MFCMSQLHSFLCFARRNCREVYLLSSTTGIARNMPTSTQEAVHTADTNGLVHIHSNSQQKSTTRKNEAIGIGASKPLND